MKKLKKWHLIPILIKCVVPTLIIIALLSVCLQSCSKRQKTILQKQTTKEQISISLHKNAIFPSVGIIYGDNKFTLVTEKWLDYEFIAEWWDFKKHFGNLYLKESNDCEDHVRGAAFLAQQMHAKRVYGSGLAFGEFWYQKVLGGVAHAINIVAVEDGDSFQFLFFDPQLSAQVTLTLSEIASCYFVRF